MNRVRGEISKAVIEPLSVDKDGVLTCGYRFASDFVGFRGHFPGHPLLPAFIQILLSVAMIETHRKDDLRVSTISKAKFKREIPPGSRVVVRCTPRKNDFHMTYDVTLMMEEGVAALFQIAFDSVKAEDDQTLFH